MSKRPNLYALLGLLRSASMDDVRRAYLKAAKKLHPDKNIAPGETELFLDVQQAYQVLSDPQRRAAYDATLPKEAVPPPSPLKLKLMLSRNEIPPSQDGRLIYVMLELCQAEQFKQASGPPPMNLCLALDTSTSMQGAKMDMVKATAMQLIRQLRPDDVFSVVSFNDRAEVTLPATRQINIQRATTQVQMLQPRGATEIYHGLQAALEEVRRYSTPSTINHIILLTDGHTYGDEEKCYALAKAAAEEGIGISGLGIGSGWNDIFLDHISHSTGGNCMYVAQPQDIEKLLKDKFTHLAKTFADNVSLFLQGSPETKIAYAFRMEPESSPLVVENPIRLGPIFYDTPLSVLLELTIPNTKQNEDTIQLLRGHLETSAASLGAALISLPLNVTLGVNKNSLTQEAPPAEIIQALSRLTLYRLQDKARLAAKDGNYEKATQHLQRMATHLLAQGERNLAKTVLLEIESLEKEHKFSETGEKSIKYGTRALMTMGGRKP